MAGAFLAPRRDGGAHARQRVPALGDDGQGRRVSRRPVLAGAGDAVGLAEAHHPHRRGHDGTRRLRRVAQERLETDLRLQHRLAAWAADDDVRAWRADARRRTEPAVGRDADPQPRAVQGAAISPGRRDRARDSHARAADDARPDSPRRAANDHGGAADCGGVRAGGDAPHA